MSAKTVRVGQRPKQRKRRWFWTRRRKPTPDASDKTNKSGRAHLATVHCPLATLTEDAHDSANALWTLYGKEAKSHDEAGIQNLTDDMDGVLIFVRLCPTARLWFSLMRSTSPIGRIVSRYSHFVFDRH